MSKHIHYFYGTLQVGIGQTLCSFEHVSCLCTKMAPDGEDCYEERTYKFI